MFDEMPRYAKATLAMSALAPFLLFLLPERPPPLGYHCVTSLSPYTAYIIEPTEWDASICYNNGPRGQRSRVPMTNEERQLLKTKYIPFLN